MTGRPPDNAGIIASVRILDPQFKSFLNDEFWQRARLLDNPENPAGLSPPVSAL